MPHTINCRLSSFWGLIVAGLENNLTILQKKTIVLLFPPQKLLYEMVPISFYPWKGKFYPSG